MEFVQSIKTLRRHPGFATSAVLTLALGIGLFTAFSSGADALLLRPLPVPDPARMVRVYTAAKFQPLGYVSYPDYTDLTRDSATLGGAVAQVQILASAGTASESAASGEAPRVRMGLAVTANYFSVLRVHAQAGRTIDPSDAHEPVVVLAYGFWRSQFNASRSVIGQVATIAGAPYTVIGVAPRGFGLDRFLREDFYVPMEAYAANLPTEANAPRGASNNSSNNPLNDRSKRFLSVYARLAPGADVRQAQAELAARAVRLESEYPETNLSRSAVVLTENAARWRSDRTMPWIAVILLAMAALILAIACGNVSGLLLLRAQERTGESALRAALGATPWRLLRGMQSESVLLAGGGLVLGVPFAAIAVRIAARSFNLPADFAIQIAPEIGGRAFAWAVLAALSVALIGGFVPWLALRRVEPADTLKRAASKISVRSKTRDVLIVGQVALAAAPLGGCASMVQQMFTARRIDLGYRTDHVLVMAFDPAQLRADETRARAFYISLLDAATQIPGIRRVALAQSVPLGMTGAQRQVRIGDALEPTAIWMNTVTPDYFELMHMRFVEGRGFGDSDTAEGPLVAVINEAMAKLWPGGLKMNSGASRTMTIGGRQVRVVGVVRTAKYFEIGEAPRPFFYLPFAQNYASRMFLHVETAGNPSIAAPAVISRARSIDPRQPVSEVRALGRYFDQGALFGLRTGVRVAGTAAACALLLALAGVYVSLARTVQRSGREIGIRLTVGATRGSIARHFTLRGMRLVSMGALAGAVLTACFNSIWGRLLPALGEVSVAALASAFLLVLLVGAGACAGPTWRAARLDPAVTLRQD